MIAIGRRANATANKRMRTWPTTRGTIHYNVKMGVLAPKWHIYYPRHSYNIIIYYMVRLYN
jgi:hypothetical protein